MYEILVGLVKLMAPVLSFTADEIWRYIPIPDRAASVHLAEFPQVRTDLLDEGLAREWDRLLAIRDQVLRALEVARKDRRIGSAQEAAVEVQADGEELEFLARHQEALETICIVSRLTVRPAQSEGAGAALAVRVDRAPGHKCQRCWNYRESVGASATHPSLCDRCLGVLQGS